MNCFSSTWKRIYPPTVHLFLCSLVTNLPIHHPISSSISPSIRLFVCATNSLATIHEPIHQPIHPAVCPFTILTMQFSRYSVHQTSQKNLIFSHHSSSSAMSFTHVLSAQMTSLSTSIIQTISRNSNFTKIGQISVCK